MYSAKNKESPQELLKEIESHGGRLLLTIPFNSTIDKCVGFVAISGNEKTLPILTICVQNISLDTCTVSTIVFPSSEDYSKFADKIYFDSCNHFSQNEVTYE